MVFLKKRLVKLELTFVTIKDIFVIRRIRNDLCLANIKSERVPIVGKYCPSLRQHLPELGIMAVTYGNSDKIVLNIQYGRLIL